MAVSKPGIDEPILPPIYPVTDNNRSAYILLTAVIMIVLTGLAVLVKLQMTVSTFRKLRRDDVALVTALFFAIAYTIAICRAVHHGLGRAGSVLTSSETRLLSEHYYAANILVWPSMAASKCAVALLILAIGSPRRWIVTALYVVLGISTVWGLAATFTVAFQCGPTRYVLGPTSTDTCIDQFGAQIGIRLIDIATDIALCLLPAMMMMYVQTSVEIKILVSATFGMRLVTPIFTAISLSALSPFYAHPTPTRTFSAVQPSIWTTMALNASLLTACLPSIKRVLSDWAAGLSNANIREPFELQNSSNGATSRTGGEVMTHPRSHTRSKVEHSKRAEEDDANYAYYLRQGRGDSGRSEDAESKRGLTDGILQTLDYSVEFEEERHGMRR